MKKILVAVALACLPAILAHAGQLAGVTLPDRETVDGTSLVLNGMGLRKAYVVASVYVAGLYLEGKSSDPAAVLGSEQAKRLVLRFVRDVGRDRIVEAWSDGFAKNAVKDLSALKDRITLLNSWMPDLAKGDTLTFTFLPSKGVVVDVNGQEKGTIVGDDFARGLLSIWLGASPPNASLKAGLLGRS